MLAVIRCHLGFVLKQQRLLLKLANQFLVAQVVKILSPTRDFALFGEQTEVDVHLDRLVGGTGLNRYAGQCPLGVLKEGLDVLLRDDEEALAGSTPGSR